MKLQLKPYLVTWRAGSTLRIGNMPPRGIEIEDAPAEMDEVIRVLSKPTTLSEAAEQLNGLAGIPAEGWTDTIEQLIDAGVVGEQIPQDGRYARHLLYYDLLGEDPYTAQSRLTNATVAIVGTGGIGSNVATLLAAAGVGNLVLTDGDTVELSNLTRQFLYDESSVGRSKVAAALDRLSLINSETKISTHETPATRALLLDVLAGCDVVIVSADSPDELYDWADEGSRLNGYAYLVAGYIEAHGTIGPLVLPGSSACYGCMRLHKDSLESVEADKSVLGHEGANLNRGHQAASYGPLNSIMAAMAANEVIRLLSGGRCETVGRRLLLDSRNYGFTTEDFQRLDECELCGSLPPHRWAETAINATSIEDVYEASRGSDSMNAIVLDEFLFGLTRFESAHRVFDYGCGTGEQSMRIAADGATVIAFDPSPGMISQFRAALSETSGLAITTTQDRDDPATDGVYDAIVCTNVLDLIPPEDIEDAISWIRLHLASDGRAIVTIPHPIKDGARWLREATSDGWDYREMRLDEYFREGAINKHWETSGGEVSLRALRSFHRTIGTYVSMFAASGLVVEQLHEPQPPASVEVEFPEIWAKTSKVPYFLTFVLRPTS